MCLCDFLHLWVSIIDGKLTSGTYPFAKDVSPRERGNKTTLGSLRLSCLNTLHFEQLKIIRGKTDCQHVLECSFIHG